MRPLRPLVLLLALAATVGACDSGSGGSLYDPDDTGAPAPVIASVSPQGIVLAGIDEIMITGQNFSATPTANVVFFDDGAGAVARGTILAASETELRVKVPNLPNTALKLRVTVQGARDFSNAVDYPLIPSFVPFGDLDAGISEEPNGVASDPAGNLYVSLTEDGNARGIKRFAPDGTREDYVESGNVWTDLALDADGALYGAFRVQALFRLPTDARQQTLQPVLPAGTRLGAIDFDADGNLWGGGDATAIYRFDLAGDAVASPFTGDVRALVASGGMVYVAAVRRANGVTSAGVFRLPVQPDGTLGAEALLYDVTGTLGSDARPSSLVIAADGTLYVGIAPAQDNLTLEAAIVEILASGEASVLYPGVLPTPIRAMAWGEGSELYVVQGRRIAVVNGSERILPAALFTVETRRQGAP